MDERKYPIYKVGFVWDQDDCKQNRTSFQQMFHEEQTKDQLDAYALEFWDKYIHTTKRKFESTPLIEKHPVDMTFTAEYVEHETWCERWFSHETFNTHLTDDELRRSFSDYVDRKRRQLYAKGDSDGDGLMGAADYWRWKGPCRCEGCTQRGVVTFDH